MTKNEILAFAEKFIEESGENYIPAPKYAGMKIFDAPIFAFGCPEDEYFQLCKEDYVIGSHFLPPLEWLPSAKTVISFFLPYTEKIREANAKDFRWPAEEWLHGRYEGQIFLKSLALQLQNFLQEAGHPSLAPAFHQNYGVTGHSSNWSERHIAYACGLGTFGISKGIITAKGTCGRLGSILTELDLPKTARLYKDIYEYCTKCAACIPHCPANAISLTTEKDDNLCAAFLNKVMEKNSPRYGCGKCQVKVPCESGIPSSPTIDNFHKK